MFFNKFALATALVSQAVLGEITYEPCENTAGAPPLGKPIPNAQCATVSASTVIDASIDRVWEILTDDTKYNEWNSFVHQINTAEGDSGLRVDSILQLNVTMSDNSTSVSDNLVTGVKKVYNGTKFTKGIWNYESRGDIVNSNMITSFRTQRVKLMNNGKIRLYSEERFDGWGSAMGFVPVDVLDVDFATHVNDLKAQAEKLCGGRTKEKTNNNGYPIEVLNEEPCDKVHPCNDDDQYQRVVYEKNQGRDPQSYPTCKPCGGVMIYGRNNNDDKPCPDEKGELTVCNEGFTFQEPYAHPNPRDYATCKKNKKQ
eukprot:Pgem_evm1s594